MVSIIHAPPQEIVVTGLTSFNSQQNLASMIAFVMNVSGQPMALYWAEGVVFLADFVEPEALPDEYVRERSTRQTSHTPLWPSTTTSSGSETWRSLSSTSRQTSPYEIWLSGYARITSRPPTNLN